MQERAVSHTWVFLKGSTEHRGRVIFADIWLKKRLYVFTGNYVIYFREVSVTKGLNKRSPMF